MFCLAESLDYAQSLQLLFPARSSNLSMQKQSNFLRYKRNLQLQVYRDDTTIIFAWKKESDEKEKNYLPQPQNFLNISTKPLR